MHLAVFSALTMALIAKYGTCSTEIPYCLNSGQKITNSTDGLTVSGVLPKQLGLSVVCQFSTGRNSSQFLSIKLKKEDNSNGSLRVSVYDAKMSSNVGNLAIKTKISQETRLCLSTAVNHQQANYVAVISGTPQLRYSVSIEFASHHLTLNKGKQYTGPHLFYFSTLQSKPNAQLDITVKSNDGEKAILKVSTLCDQVVKLGVINKQQPAISLTFAKQGRITISKVSRPALSSSRPLFIGVLSADGRLGDSINNKSFTINVTNSFDYDYAAPLCFIVFVPCIGGILVALWALYSFREPLDFNHGASDSTSVGSSFGSSVISKASSIACWSGRTPNELTPLIRQPSISLSISATDILWGMLKVLKYHWSGHGSRAFSYMTCVVGFVLFVGAFQYVYETWNIMVEDGNRDKCFYDDLCYRVSPYDDIPFNLMISNMAYIVHGVILAIAVWVMEAELYVHARKKSCLDQANKDTTHETSTDQETLPRHLLVCSNISHHLPKLTVPPFKSEHRLIELYAHAYKSKYSFSVGYAFAWALIFEGFFSLTYHLCPSRLSFQFDTAFMFVISGLIVVSLFNGLAVRECQEQETLPRPIEDTSFYLFVIVPLYILNYLGSVFNTKNRKSNVVNAVFLVFIVCWYLWMFSWCGFKLFYVNIRRGFHNWESLVKLVLFCLTVGCTCIVFPILFNADFSNLFLFSCITVAVMSTIGKIILKAFKAPPARYPTWKAVIFKVLQMAYVLVALAIMGSAIYVFDGIPTTDKTESPENSRNLNKECAFLGFYDYHDIWHVMSSFALLMGAFLVMYISE